ncbi:hypothetical protein ACLKA6_006325 [Drosophila palustris]
MANGKVCGAGAAAAGAQAANGNGRDNDNDNNDDNNNDNNRNNNNKFMLLETVSLVLDQDIRVGTLHALGTTRKRTWMMTTSQ